MKIDFSEIPESDVPLELRAKNFQEIKTGIFKEGDLFKGLDGSFFYAVGYVGMAIERVSRSLLGGIVYRPITKKITIKVP